MRNDLVKIMTPQCKQALRNFLHSCIEKENTGFCCTTDITTNTLQKKAYMAVTVHFIIREHNWTLYNTLLSFEQIQSPHTGYNIASKFHKTIAYYELQNNIFSSTLDNTSNNDAFVDSISHRIPLMLDGQFFQNRCNAHIYNLIAQDALISLRTPKRVLRSTFFP